MAEINKIQLPDNQTYDILPEPLTGTTDDVTPSQVLAAIQTGRDVYIQCMKPSLADWQVSSFSYRLGSNYIMSSDINDDMLCCTLIGDLMFDEWSVNYGVLALESNVPTKTSDLVNDSGYITSYTDEKLKVTQVPDDLNLILYPVLSAWSDLAHTQEQDRTGLAYYYSEGSSTTTGTAQLRLGNNKTKTADRTGNKQGTLLLYGSTGYAHTISGAPTAERTLTLPDKTGTIALTSDIPTVPSPSATIPLMDGTAAAGISTLYARADHVHPSDTSKQDTLVSGTNIKTINSQSLLGSGDISIGGLQNLVDGSSQGSIRGIGTVENVASYAIALGYGSIASSRFQLATGMYNVEDKIDTYAFIIGNGNSDTDRYNIFTVDWEGNVEANGQYYGDDYILCLNDTATSGTDYEILQALKTLGWDVTP